MREKTLRLLPTLFKSLNADSLASDMDLYCSACCLACCNWSSRAKIRKKINEIKNRKKRNEAYFTMRNVIANSLLSHTHNTPCLSPKVLHEHCFQFLLRLLVRELEKNTYANFVLGGGGKLHFGVK